MIRKLDINKKINEFCKYFGASIKYAGTVVIFRDYLEIFSSISMFPSRACHYTFEGSVNTEN